MIWCRRRRSVQLTASVQGGASQVSGKGVRGTALGKGSADVESGRGVDAGARCVSLLPSLRLLILFLSQV